MDAAWPLIARAVMRPVLGDLVERLAQLHIVSDDPGAQGSAYIAGWYGYVEKDLRALLGRRVEDPYSTRYCGRGDVDACRESLWAAITRRARCLRRSTAPIPRPGSRTPERSASTSQPAC